MPEVLIVAAINTAISDLFAHVANFVIAAIGFDCKSIFF